MKRKTIYKARPGYPLSDDEATILGNFITANFPNKDPNPKELLELAKPKTSPIHKFFDWDDASAAHKYRIRQARELINCLVVVIDQKPVKAYHRVYVEATNEKRYMDVQKVRNTPELWEQVLGNAMRDALAWKQRYETFKSIGPLLEPIFEAITTTHRRIKK